jgi:hypothetical protein
MSQLTHPDSDRVAGRQLLARRTTRARARFTARAIPRLVLTMVAVMVWLRGDGVVDDRGSESTEKAFMVILAIALGTAVSAAAIAFVATKTALFR